MWRRHYNLDIHTHKLICVANWLCNMFFMKVKLLKVFSSSIESNTCTIAITVTFMYSFNFMIRRGEDWTFNHIWMIVFTSKASHHCINIMTNGEFEMKSLHVKLLWIQNPTDHNSYFEFFINTKCSFDPI